MNSSVRLARCREPPPLVRQTPEQSFVLVNLQSFRIIISSECGRTG
jgi:hypothetical protein